MRTLLALAVMGVVARQASCSPTYTGSSSGSHAYGYAQPYVGPLASSVPAGVDGKVIPVADTPEVVAAKDTFFRSYQDQVNTINSIRSRYPQEYGAASYYSGPGLSAGAAAGPVFTSTSDSVAYSHSSPVSFSQTSHVSHPHTSYSPPSSYSHSASSGPSTHGYGYSQPRYVGPLASTVPAGIDGKVIPVSETPEVSAARYRFFQSYQDQLNTINAIRASRPAPYHAGERYGSVHVSHPAPAYPTHY